MLFFTRIYCEKYNHSKLFIQCFRFQAHGHTSANCTKTYKCIKCTESHNSHTCKKSSDTPTKCVNCKGSHTANYCRCPALLNYLNKKSIKTLPKQQIQVITSSILDHIPKIINYEALQTSPHQGTNATGSS